MNQYYSENVQVDFTPVFERWGFKLNHKQIEMNRAKGYPAVTSLAYIVPESQLAKARALVDPDIPINSNFEIVTNQQIASLGLKGNLHIHLNTNEIDTLKGRKIKLKEGNTVVQEKQLKQQISIYKTYQMGFIRLKFQVRKWIECIISVRIMPM